MIPLVPVILSGGSGTRLWPASREAHPKQFLPLTGERSLLQATWLRLAQVPETAPPLVVGNEEHRFLIAEQLREVGAAPGPIVLEPVGRNTAPAIAAAALVATADGSDPLLLVLPSDHLIGDEAAFRAAVALARPVAEAGALVTFGIVPDAPETGFGYIKAAGSGEGARAVERFVEKPDLATARAYLASGEYTWNSGMFLFRASRLLEELAATRPQMLEHVRAAVAAARRDADFLRLDRTAFAAAPSESIDYAVMEHTRRAAVVPLAAGWSDVGSWSALWQVGERDGNGNCLRGDVIAMDSRGTLAHAPRRLLALIGVEDLVVVDTEDALLVARRDRVQQVKELVAQLKAEGRPQAQLHRKVFRPWGSFEQVDAGERFQVKRIVVKPGAALSLQMHHHRAEHWIVVRGTARVTCDDRVFPLHENESTFIPLGSKHRLENPGDEPLELIEVQSGSYLGEDDIVRFEDVYGRQAG
jgi:mannose-1-phosphate guanylyltransferase/mannose-6-phosphate isomerase